VRATSAPSCTTCRLALWAVSLLVAFVAGYGCGQVSAEREWEQGP
jgi:hypothetical protein